MGQTVSPPALSRVQVAGTEEETAVTISANTKKIGLTLKISVKKVVVILLL